MIAPERPGPQVTDDDLHHADVEYATRANHERGLRAALASTLRPGGLVARAIADELERLAGHYPRDVFSPAGYTRDAIAGTALRTVLTAQAKLWREPKR